ncbi:hypothetical protein CSKR_203931 [Clonorchis sinensis]|uniref:Uncharacterized protein n=1 Tax=Clonorchis sinensis TaxID=79923 RepID=A0A8T1MGA5_CLOSI|nr:hypothetical protein CSKR_203931 [Clonorchis sinensis]
MLEEEASARPYRPFIWVHFGNNEKILVNLDCSYEILVQFLISTCGLSDNAVFDLCDATGSLLNINNPQTYAQLKNTVEGGTTYVLVEFKNEVPDERDDIKPSLIDYDLFYPNIKEIIWKQFQEKSDRRRRPGRQAAGGSRPPQQKKTKPILG